MLSAFSVQRCPPSRWNTVRHQHGIVSAIAWNTQAYRTSDSIGVLRVQAGHPSNVDDIVQQQFLMDIRKRLEQEGVPKSSAQALTGAQDPAVQQLQCVS